MWTQQVTITAVDIQTPAGMQFIIKIWKSQSLQECLKTIGYFHVPKGFAERLIHYLDILYISVFIGRTLILTVYPNAFFEKIFCHEAAQPSVLKVSQICAALAYFEIITVRLWFHGRVKMKNGLDFVQLLSQYDPVNHRRIVTGLKCSGFALTTLTSSLFALICLWHIRRTPVDEYFILTCQVCWLLLIVNYIRVHTYDIPVTYATAIVVNLVIHKKMEAFDDSIDHIKSRKHFALSYLRVVHAVLISRELISLINQLNRMIVVPFCGMVITQLYLDPDDDQSVMMRRFVLTIGFGYTARGYMLIGFCSMIYHKSQKIHTHLASISARNNLIEPIKRSILFIVWDIASQYNHLTFVDSNDSKIDRLDLVKNGLETIVFFTLVIQFRAQIL